MKRKTIVAAVQIASFIGFIYLFLFQWVPWAGCRSVAELPPQSVPAGARCYNINHGEVVFSYIHGTTKEDPWPFGLLSIAVIWVYGALVCTYLGYPDSPLARLSPGFHYWVMSRDKP